MPSGPEVRPGEPPSARGVSGLAVQAARIDGATNGSSTTVVHVLDLDPDLGTGIGRDDWELARSVCRAKLVHAQIGRIKLPDAAGERDDRFGLLIVDGLLCREVPLGDRYMFELLGPGDVLQMPAVGGSPRLGGSIRLTAATDTLLVTLGRSYIRAAGRWPSLMASCLRRIEAQRQRLAVQGLIAHLPRADDRVLLLLWHLADRWGHVTPTGTVLPVPLTHDVLGHLTAARRSTVTLAVSALEDEDCIRRVDHGYWLLTDAAERKVETMASTSSAAPVLGESLMLRHRARENSRRRANGSDG
jgi:CRP/FNR family transcriptional regulator, cyclic AMP receptor protein